MKSIIDLSFRQINTPYKTVKIEAVQHPSDQPRIWNGTTQL